MAEEMTLEQAIKEITELKRDNERLKKALKEARATARGAVSAIIMAMVGICVLILILGVNITLPNGVGASFSIVPSPTTFRTHTPVVFTTQASTATITSSPTVTLTVVLTISPTAGRPTQTALPSPTLDPRFKVRVQNNRIAYLDEELKTQLQVEGAGYFIDPVAYDTGKKVPMCEWVSGKRQSVLNCTEKKGDLTIVYYVAYQKGDVYTEATPSK